MSINMQNDEFINEEGKPIPKKHSMKYLGALLSSDGYYNSEISRRIGMAAAEFSLLHKCWQHSCLSVKRKYELYNTLVLSKLLYGLESVTLRMHDKKKLDAFHARCCRRILRISPAFVSRISNAYVLQTIESIKLSHMILIRQLKFFGSLARRSNDDLLRSFIFHPDSHVVKIPLDRPRGRPRLTWKATMHKHACDIIHDYSSLISDAKKWSSAVIRFCNSLK